MIRSHKPRGFLWNCATPFQQTTEFRNIQYQDCVPPHSTVLLDERDEDVAVTERAAKRRRIEELAHEFLDGKTLEIPAARTLRLPPRARRYIGYRDVADGEQLQNVPSDISAPLWVEEQSDVDVIRAASCLLASKKSSPKANKAVSRRSARLSGSMNSQHIVEARAQAACRPERKSRTYPVLTEPILESSRPTPESVNQVASAHTSELGPSAAPPLFAQEHDSSDDEEASRLNGTKRPPNRPSRIAGAASSPFVYRVRKFEKVHTSKAQDERNVPVPEPRNSPNAAHSGAQQTGGFAVEEIGNDINNMSTLPTPIGDRHLNTILPKDPPASDKSKSLKRSIRAEWRLSGADISMASPSPSPFDEEAHTSSDIPHLINEVASTVNNKFNPAKPLQTPRAFDGTQNLLSKAKQNFFASSRKRSLVNLTQGETSSESPLTISSQPLPRRPLQQLPQESLPGTQTVLDGWTGFSTVKKPRTYVGKSRRSSLCSLSGNEIASPLDPDLQVAPEASTARPASPTESSAVQLSIPSAMIPSPTESKEEDKMVEMEPPSFTALSAHAVDEGTEAQGLFTTSWELIDDHMGDAVAFRALLSQ